jgi:hypothetical protein
MLEFLTEEGSRFLPSAKLLRTARAVSFTGL